MKAAVDSNIIIHSRRGKTFEEAYTVPGVLNELETEKAKRNADTMNLETQMPSENSIEEVKEASEKINSPTSDVDEELAALALDKDLTLVTDDKALQNLSMLLEIEFEAFMETEIDEVLQWKRRCSNCGSEIKKVPCHRCSAEQSELKAYPYN